MRVYGIMHHVCRFLFFVGTLAYQAFYVALEQNFLIQQRLGQLESGSVEDLAQLGSDGFAQGDPRHVVQSILLEMELATLPQDAREARATSGLEAGVIVADDEERPMEAALLE